MARVAFVRFASKAKRKTEMCRHLGKCRHLRGQMERVAEIHVPDMESTRSGLYKCTKEYGQRVAVAVVVFNFFEKNKCANSAFQGTEILVTFH